MGLFKLSNKKWEKDLRVRHLDTLLGVIDPGMCLLA